MTLIKKRKDFLFGVFMLLTTGYFLMRDNVKGNIGANPPGGYFARADVYLNLLLYILLALAVLLIIGSINYKKEEVEKLTFDINLPAVLTMGALVIYTFVLPIIGFIISTFLLVSFLVVIYSINESKNYTHNKGKELRKIMIKGAVYSIVSVVALYVVFSNLLNVNLP